MSSPTMRRLAGCALLALALVSAPAEAVQVSDQLRVQFARAEMLFRSGDLEGARTLLDRVIGELAEVETRADADTLLLRRALLYRARLAWDEGDRSTVDADLDRLLEIDPAIDLSEEAVPTGLAERLEARRERRVGYLQIALFPQDATVTIDGKRVEDPTQILPLAAGVHVVEARRPGYAPASQEVDIRANRTEGVGFELQRTGATISIATHPAGATVAVDDRILGTTAPGGPEGVSEPFRIVDLLPGTHLLTVTLADHRPFEQRVDIPALSDYDLGTLRLERALGTLVLRDLPAGARVEIDGRTVEVERRVGANGTPLSVGAARITLPVGGHQLRIASPGGVFESRVEIGDGDTLGIDVDPEPGIAYLGVASGESLDKRAVDDVVEAALERADGWFLLDRRDRLAGLGRLPEGEDDRRGWTRLQRAASRLEPGAALFVFATLPESGRVDRFTLWVLASEPGPAAPWALVAEMGAGDALAPLVEALGRPLPSGRAWLGATTIDTGLAEGARVLAVEPGSPAANGGLQPGDLLRSVDGNPIVRAAELLTLVAESAPFRALTLDLERQGERMALPVRLGASPLVPADRDGLAPDPIVWAAAFTGLEDPEATLSGWVLAFHQGLALLRSGAHEAAADVLGRIRVSGDPPFGQAAVDYWLGIALSTGSEVALEEAHAAFARAASRPGARFEHNDGPFVSPRARARLARIEAEQEPGDPDGGH